MVRGMIQESKRKWDGDMYQINPVERAFTEMESEKQGKEAAVKVEDKVVKVEDKHSLVFFICAWLGVGG